MSTESTARMFESDRYPEAELTAQIIGAAHTVRRELRCHYSEAVFRNALMVSLRERGLDSEREVPTRVQFHGCEVGFFKVDLLVEGRVLVEVKAGRPLDAAHEAQILNYLSTTGVRVGLLIHFGDKVTVRRFVL